MASALKNLSSYEEENIPAGEKMKIGIVVAEWNKHITHALYEGAFETLTKHGVAAENIEVLQVPGAFELPYGARFLLSQKPLDGVICIGCVIKGETKHDEYINNAVATGITNLSLSLNKPIIYGVLTPNDEQQALDRAGGKHGNKGIEAAVTALRMIGLKQDFQAPKGKIGFTV
jgi:6,7-dimethyl-8-ribityllumazine synthase